jgi:hypothetical protein
MDFRGTALPLSPGGLDAALAVLAVPAPEIWTVIAVETGGCGFLPDRRPVILFERHIFHRRTTGAFDATHPGISNATPGGYLGGAREYDRLAEAAALDRTAALESASWGLAQIMGFNAAAAGFASAEAMVAEMMAGEDAQVTGMAAFLRSKTLDVPLAAHDWVAFATGYNGADFAKNQYDQRLAAAFRQFSRGSPPDLLVRHAQVLLMFLGISPGRIDGLTGPRTKGAVNRFREQQGLPSSDQIDDALIASLTAAVCSAV